MCVCVCVITRERVKLVCLVPAGMDETPDRGIFLGKRESFHSGRMVDSTPSQALSTPACFSVCAEGETLRLCINLLPTELTFTWLARSPCVSGWKCFCLSVESQCTTINTVPRRQKPPSLYSRCSLIRRDYKNKIYTGTAGDGVHLFIRGQLCERHVVCALPVWANPQFPTFSHIHTLKCWCFSPLFQQLLS